MLNTVVENFDFDSPPTIGFPPIAGIVHAYKHTQKQIISKRNHGRITKIGMQNRKKKKGIQLEW